MTLCQTKSQWPTEWQMSSRKDGITGKAKNYPQKNPIHDLGVSTVPTAALTAELLPTCPESHMCKHDSLGLQLWDQLDGD